MRPCTCSIRAFESFVQDFAGVSIRQSQRRVHLSQRRTFGNRSPFQRPEVTTISAAQGDDGFVSLSGVLTPQHDEIGGRENGAKNVSVLASRNPAGKSEREQNRLERKRRRIESGTFKAKAIQQIYQGAEEQPQRQAKTEIGNVEGLGVPDAKVAVKEDLEAYKPTRLSSTRKKGMRSSSKVGGRESVAAIKEGTKAKKPRSSARMVRTRVNPEDGRKNIESDGKEKLSVEESVSMTRRGRMRSSTRTGRDASKSVAVKQKSMQMKTVERKTKAFVEERSPQKTERPSTLEPLRKRRAKETWQVQKAALERKFGDQGWQPSKRLSPDTLEGIRALNVSDPNNYSTEVLAKHFEITPEAIRRILKSKWRPNTDEAEDRRQRWEKRGTKKWTEMAELGMRPPAKWRALGVTSKEQQEKRRKGGGKREKREVAWEEPDETAAGDLLSGRIL